MGSLITGYAAGLSSDKLKTIIIIRVKHGECYLLAKIDPCTIITLEKIPSSSAWIFLIFIPLSSAELDFQFLVLWAKCEIFSWKVSQDLWRKEACLAWWLCAGAVLGTNFPFKLSFRPGSGGKAKTWHFVLTSWGIWMFWDHWVILSLFFPDGQAWGLMYAHSTLNHWVGLFRIRASFSGLLTYFLEKVWGHAVAHVCGWELVTETKAWIKLTFLASIKQYFLSVLPTVIRKISVERSSHH